MGVGAFDNSEGKPGGRPRSIDVRAVVNAIFYSRTAVSAYPEITRMTSGFFFTSAGVPVGNLAPEVECHHLIGWSPDALSRIVPRAGQAVFIHVLRLHPHAAEGAAATSDNKSSITHDA